MNPGDTQRQCIRLASRVAQRFVQAVSPEADLIRSLNSLMKSKGGLFVSPKQAAFIYRRAHAIGDRRPFIDAWAHHYHTGPNSIAFGLMTVDTRFGRSDLSKVRMYGFAYVLDGAGVVAAAKLNIDHPKEDQKSFVPVGLGETLFVRREAATEKYDHAAVERARHELISKNKPMIDQIMALPGYDKEEILQSFVTQLEHGKSLSPAQKGILRKFMPVELDTDRFRSTRDELFQLFEDRIVDAALKWYAHAKGHLTGDIAEHAAWAAEQTREIWEHFKARPTLAPEVGGAGFLSALVIDSGWKKPAGVTGALDTLARADQLAKKGQRAPASALKTFWVIENLLEWLRGATGKVEHHLSKYYALAEQKAEAYEDPFKAFSP